MAPTPIHGAPDAGVDLSEEQASQGYKTGHMRWVLGVGLALACLAMAALVIANIA